MCIVCQNAPTMMTALAGSGLVIRTAIRRARNGRTTDEVICRTGTDGARPAAYPPVGAAQRA
jgi:hypothetical protein